MVRAAGPENDSEDDDQGSDGNESPWNFRRAVGEIFAARTNVLDAGKLQFGEFLDLRRDLWFQGRQFGLAGAIFFECWRTRWCR